LDKNSTCYTSWLHPALTKNHQGDVCMRSCRCSAFHHSTRSRPGDVRQRQTRPAIAARVVGPPGTRRRFHKHNNPAYIPPAIFSLDGYFERLRSPGYLMVHHVKIPSSLLAVWDLRCLQALADYQRGTLKIQCDKHHHKMFYRRRYVSNSVLVDLLTKHPFKLHDTISFSGNFSK
jgi:hypothetical protein